MSKINVTINTANLRGIAAPLYYPRQNGPLSAFVEMDEQGNVSAGINYEIGGAVPAHVWHNRTLRWGVSPYANGNNLANLLESERVRELFERVHNGHSVEWDGSNMVGRLDEDAAAAALELEQVLSPESGEYEMVQVCTAHEFIADWLSLDDLIEAGSVEACVKRLGNDSDRLVIVGNLEEAVASRARRLIERDLDSGEVDSATVLAAEILVEYDEHAFSDLLKECREALELEE